MGDSWTDEKRSWSFWSKVIQGDGGCWLWTGNTRANGYGAITRNRPDGGPKATTVHRLAYEEYVGPIPEGHEVDHLCGVRNCVRPEHLEAVTVQENRRRRDIKYRPAIPHDERPIPHYEKPPRRDQRRLLRNGEPNPDWKPKPPATHCVNGHEYAVVGKAKNGKNWTCAACAKERRARRTALYPRKQVRHGLETHCPQGHPYTPENVYFRKRGGRECRICVNARNLAAYHRRRDARKAAAS